MSEARRTDKAMSRRAKNAARCAELRAQGMLQREIAAATGLSQSTVSEYLSDPDGTRVAARKRSYDGVCSDCGGRTSGTDGPPAERCNACTRAREHAERYWTRPRILAAIWRFTAENGRKPLATDWLYGKHGILADGYPYTSIVRREFGNWNDAMVAAGLPAEGPGKYVRTEETRRRMSESRRRRAVH